VNNTRIYAHIYKSCPHSYTATRIHVHIM